MTVWKRVRLWVLGPALILGKEFYGECDRSVNHQKSSSPLIKRLGDPSPWSLLLNQTTTDWINSNLCNWRPPEMYNHSLCIDWNFYPVGVLAKLYQGRYWIYIFLGFQRYFILMMTDNLSLLAWIKELLSKETKIEACDSWWISSLNNVDNNSWIMVCFPSNIRC